VYADGRAEEIIGRWLAARPGRPELAVLATKGRLPTDESPNGHGLSLWVPVNVSHGLICGFAGSGA
jgi:aryl-alcohol dehydrogenase-like predicted oxidoreductase